MGKRLITSLVALLICVVALGEETNWTFSNDYVEVDGLYYRLDQSNMVAQFLAGNYETEDVTVPETVKYDNVNYTVCSVDKNRIYNSKVKALTLPATIKEIKEYAFSYWNILKRLTLKSSVPPTLGGNLGQSNLKIYVPVGTIHAYRISNEYWNNSNVLIDGDGLSVFVTVTTPGTLAEETIKKVDYLQEVNKLSVAGAINAADLTTIKNNMPNLLEIDLSEADCASLPSSWMASRYALEKISYPKNLKSIGSSCFSYCRSIETVTLPEGLTEVGSSAFDHCYSLREVSLPSTLKETGSYMFNVCASLKTVNLAEGLTRLGNGTFSSTAIEEIVMPSTLNTIGGDVFRECKSLSKIILNEGLATIESSAFSYCTSLVEIELPASLKYCGGVPFYNCTNLINPSLT